MKILLYLYNVGAQLQGLNKSIEARERVLQYVKEVLQEALSKVEKEMEGDDGDE